MAFVSETGLCGLIFRKAEAKDVVVIADHPGPTAKKD
jgi:hypothetical protein